MARNQTTPEGGATGGQGLRVLADALLGLSLTSALGSLPVSILSGTDLDKLLPTALVGGVVAAFLAIIADRFGPNRRDFRMICVVLLLVNLAAGVGWGAIHPPAPKPTPEPIETPMLTATGTEAYQPTASVTAKITVSPSAPATPTHPPPRPEAPHTLTPTRPATMPTTSTPHRSPSSTATLRPGPLLQSPPEGASFSGVNTPVILQWQGGGSLAANEFYVVTTLRQHEQQVWSDYQWTKEEQLQIPSYIRKDATGDTFEWYVTLMRKTGTDAKGDSVGTPISANSASRHFNWTIEEPTKVITPRG